MWSISINKKHNKTTAVLSLQAQQSKWAVFSTANLWDWFCLYRHCTLFSPKFSSRTHFCSPINFRGKLENLRMSVPPLTQSKHPTSRFSARGLKNKLEPSLDQISTKFPKPELSQCPSSTKIPELHQMRRRGERNKDTNWTVTHNGIFLLGNC